MRSATRREYKEALAAYETGGQYAVSEYANERGITSWHYEARGTYAGEPANEEAYDLLNESE